MFALLKRWGLDPFILSLFAAIGLAWLQPAWGAQHDAWSPAEVAGWGVGVIFFFYGLRLTRQKLLNGLKNVKLHVLVHVSTFVVFPLIVLGAMWLFGGFDKSGTLYYIWIGSFFLATLPSTVSSSVVMVSIAGGNLPAAIFNASISSMIGVFLTPLWMGIFMDNISGSNDLADVIVKLKGLFA